MLCTGFSHELVKYQKSHSFAALTRSISDTSPTRVKILYARVFHEVMAISLTAVWSFPLVCLSYSLEVCFLLAPFADSPCIHTKFSCGAFLAVIFCIRNCFKFSAYFVTVSFPCLSSNCTVPLRQKDHFLDWIQRKIQ